MEVAAQCRCELLSIVNMERCKLEKPMSGSPLFALYAYLSTTRCLFSLSHPPIRSATPCSPTRPPMKNASIQYQPSFPLANPRIFSDYKVVSKEIRDFCRNFSTQKRHSYFKYSCDEIEVPCGFMKEFPIADSDIVAMESCREL